MCIWLSALAREMHQSPQRPYSRPPEAVCVGHPMSSRLLLGCD